MKTIVVTDEAAGTAGMKLVERPEPKPSINDVVVQVHASGFVNTELVWPSTWTDRLDRDRTPTIPGHELAGVVTALGYGTTGLTVGQRVFGLTDWYRDGTLAEYVAVEARNLALLPDDVDFTPDVIIECTGAPSVVLDALNRNTPSGIVCLAGISSGQHRIHLDVGVLNKSMVLENDAVFGSVNANRRHYEIAAEVLAKADKDWLSRLISRRVPLTHWAEAFYRQPDDVKVVLDFTL